MLGITQGRGVGDDTRVLSERRGDDAMHPMEIDCRHRSIAAFVDIFSPHKGADTHRKGPMFGNAAPSPSGRSSARSRRLLSSESLASAASARLYVAQALHESFVIDHSR